MDAPETDAFVRYIGPDQALADCDLSVADA
jgi:hypothetical protein